MSTTPTRRPGRIALYVVIPVLIIVCPLVYSVVDALFAQTADSSESFLDKALGEECLEDKRYMRYHHWELLKEIREDVVRYGRREEMVLGGKRYVRGLNSCKQCHVSKARFCDQCHNAVSLHPDCFGCHYYP